MAPTLLVLVCKDCSGPFGIAVIPDIEHIRTIIPRAFRSLVPDDMDLSGLTNQPVLCSRCAGKRGVEPFTNRGDIFNGSTQEEAAQADGNGGEIDGRNIDG